MCSVERSFVAALATLCASLRGVVQGKFQANFCLAVVLPLNMIGGVSTFRHPCGVLAQLTLLERTNRLLL